MSWTPERENKLKELWKKGYTASQIAALISETTIETQLREGDSIATSVFSVNMGRTSFVNLTQIRLRAAATKPQLRREPKANLNYWSNMTFTLVPTIFPIPPSTSEKS